MSMDDSMAGGWSIAFNLNPNVKDAANFYFDDLSWQSMVLDEGYFVAAINSVAGGSYEFDAATQFVYDDEAEVYVATVGAKNAYIDQVMISTVRGNDAAFKGNTLKPSGTIENNPDAWLDYTAASNSKLALPGLGIWKIYIDPAYSAMAFEMLEGQIVELKDVVTNSEEVTVNALEREYTEAEAEAAGIEKPENPGQPWDNQFFIMADRILKAGEVTHLKFAYKASKAAKTTTQTHGAPGAYIHWAAIGDVNFEEDWLEFDADYTVPAEADGSEGKQAQSIAFNMAEIKEACDYTVKEVQWYLVDASLEAGQTYENLISGKHNFYIKVGAGTTPTVGIENVTAKTAKTSSVIYNLAGQRVNNNFKGLVIKDGKKIVK